MAICSGRGRRTTRGDAVDVDVVDTVHHPGSVTAPHRPARELTLTVLGKRDGGRRMSTGLARPLAPPSLDAESARQAGDVPSGRVDGDADHVAADVQLLDRER